MHVLVWEWPVWFYLFVAGAAGGGFFAAFLINLFTGRKHESLLRTAAWIGVPLVLLGIVLLTIDLGHQRRVWHLFVRFFPIAPMSLGSWILLLWIIALVALIALWFAEIAASTEQLEGFYAQVASLLRPFVPLTEALSWIAFVLSTLLITYTGVLLSSTNQPMWVSVLLPALFVLSAISTGLAAVLLVSTLLGKQVPHVYGRVGAILAGLEVVALIAFLLTVPAGVLISGSLSLWFWIGVVLVGLLIPVGLELWTLREKDVTLLVLASTWCVLLGGLILRALVVIGGQV